MLRGNQPHLRKRLAHLKVIDPTGLPIRLERCVPDSIASYDPIAIAIATALVLRLSRCFRFSEPISAESMMQYDRAHVVGPAGFSCGKWSSAAQCPRRKASQASSEIA